MRLWPKLRAAARVYPYSQTEVASSNLLFARFGRNNARLPGGRGNTTEHQRSLAPAERIRDLPHASGL